MRRHRGDDADFQGPADPFPGRSFSAHSVDDDEVYLPFSGRSGRPPNAMQSEDDLDENPDDDSEPAPAAVRMRAAPKELSRRDRREWRRLEVARINRAAQSMAARRHDSSSAAWSGGFIKNPPRGLGRKGRTAWLAAEQEATKDWWAQRRASNRDIDTRAAGAAVLALVIGIVAVIALVVHHFAAAGSGTVPASSLTAPPTAFPTPTTLGEGSLVPVVPGATGSVAVATGNPAVGATPTVAPPVSGRWQPTPAGGVTPITPAPPSPVDTATVTPAAAVTGAVTAADQDSARSVVTSWLAHTCPSSWRDRFGTELTRGKALETAAAWKVDDPARDAVGAALWRSEVVVHRQTRRCGNITVTVSPDQPLTAHGGFVLFSADRVVTSADGLLPPTVEHLSGARRVIAAGGKWLVDIPVVGG